jgi:hypothetical protein
MHFFEDNCYILSKCILRHVKKRWPRMARVHAVGTCVQRGRRTALKYLFASYKTCIVQAIFKLHILYFGGG